MPTSRRLAMLEVIENHQTPLTRVSRHEVAAQVRGVGDGDVVEMVVLRLQGESTKISLAEGSTDLSPAQDWISYFFRKVAGQNPLPTTVEIVLDG